MTLDVEGTPVPAAAPQTVRTWADAMARYGALPAVYDAILADDPAIDPTWVAESVNHDALTRWALLQAVRELLRAVRGETHAR